jgi:uncharacterized membrane protein
MRGRAECGEIIAARKLPDFSVYDSGMSPASFLTPRSLSMEKQQVLSVAIGGLLALGVASSASAADKKVEMENCYGIAKAGMNDCGSKKSGHSCAGQASKNSDPNDFVALPKGTCNKIAGGSVSGGGDMMMKKAM